MKKKAAASARRTVPAKAKGDGLASLVGEVRSLIQSARRGAASVVNTLQVMTNFEIGRRIVEHEQKGEKRAGYGKELLKGLSARLREEFGRGYSEDNLALMRRFYVVFTDREIQQTPSGKLAPVLISETPSRKSPFTLSHRREPPVRRRRRADEFQAICVNLCLICGVLDLWPRHCCKSGLKSAA